jgi:arginyl-tRNA--protein-N-Asp/Glu arginylyltransferase
MNGPVFSIVTQLRLCQAWGLPWLYLGLAVQGSDRMRYKLDWFPHERRLRGTWARFERPQIR